MKKKKKRVNNVIYIRKATKKENIEVYVNKNNDENEIYKLE